jgi:hypothetical protein
MVLAGMVTSVVTLVLQPLEALIVQEPIMTCPA